MQNSNQPILLFDCDPGCDDALALALVAKKQSVRTRYNAVNVLTVAGNVSVEQTTFNAARVLAACALDEKKSDEGTNSGDRLANFFKVFSGCSRNMDGEKPSAASVHGRDGLGDAPNCLIWDKKGQSTELCQQAKIIANSLQKTIVAEGTSAVERYLAFVRDPVVSTSFDLLCTGPLTNLGCALNLMSASQRVMFWENCRNVVIMGGAFGLGGNITHSAEFNTFADPTATQVVLDSFTDFLNQESSDVKDSKRLHFVPLDATETLAILLEKNGDKDPISHCATFLRYALKQYGQFHTFHCKRPEVDDGSGNFVELATFNSELYAKAQLAGSNGDSELKRFCYLHDPLAAWILVENLCGKDIWREDEIQIETGQSQGRGRIILCEPRAKRGTTPAPIASHGLRVKWLDPAKFDGALRRKFIEEVAELLEIQRLWLPKSQSTTSYAK